MLHKWYYISEWVHAWHVEVTCVVIKGWFNFFESQTPIRQTINVSKTDIKWYKSFECIKGRVICVRQPLQSEG